MQDFTIDIIEKNLATVNNTVENTYIRMTTFSNDQSNLFSSFDEKLTLKENASISFTFSMYKECNGELNPFIDLLVNDRSLRVIRNKEVYYFVITNIQPTITQNNVKYSYTCQDEFSYNLSRRNVGLNFKTDDSEDYEDYEYAGIWGSEENCGPKTLVEIVNKILEICNIKDWRLNNSVIINHEFPDNLYGTESDMKVTMDISNSNPFNAFVQVANLFNAIINIDYELNPHLINFINKDYIQYKGYELKSDYNLQSFNYSQKGESLYNIMHITGGEDADGNYISIVPTMPQDLQRWVIGEFSSYKDKTNDWIENKIKNSEYYTQSAFKSDIDNYFKMLKMVPHGSSFLYNFDYWKDNYLISNAQYNNILEDLTINLRNINFEINAYTPMYYSTLSSFNKRLTTEEDLIANIAAEDNNIANLTQETLSQTIDFYRLKKSITINDEIISVIKLSGYTLEESTDAPYNFYYGTINGINLISYLPDWHTNFISNVSSLKFYWYDSGNKEYKLLDSNSISINDSSDIITYNTKIDGLVLNNTVELYCSLIDSFSTIGDITTIDGSCDAYIKNYKAQLQELWGKEYISEFLNLYGRTYIDDKITILNNKINEKTLLKKEYIQKILTIITSTKYADLYNDDDDLETKWIKIKKGLILQDPTSTAIIEDNAAVSSWMESIKDIEILIGGTGTRDETDTFKGRYNWYVEELQRLKIDKKEEIESYYISLPDVPIYKKLFDTSNGLFVQRDKWWQNFYAKNSNCIRETSYNDDNQLSSEGLYSSAYKQFISYQNPNESFSASYINSNMITNYINAKIGDIINVYQPKIFNKSKNNYIIHLANYRIKDFDSNKIAIIDNYSLDNLSNKSVFLLKTNTDGKFSFGTTSVVKFDALKVELIDCKKENNYIVYIKDNNDHSSESNFNIRSYNYIFIDNQLIRLNAITDYKTEEPVKLVISGITKNFRSTVEQLTVTKYSSVNYIIDQLLYTISR